MKIAELIAKLSELDPQREVAVEYNHQDNMAVVIDVLMSGDRFAILIIAEPC